MRLCAGALGEGMRVRYKGIKVRYKGKGIKVGYKGEYKGQV